MSEEQTVLKRKVISMFLTEGFQLGPNAISRILNSVDPLQLATKTLEKAKASSPKPLFIMSDFLDDITIPAPPLSLNMAEEEMAKVILVRLQGGELLHSIFGELQKVLERDSFYVKNLLERLWRKGVLPLHDYEAHHFVKFLTDKKLQGTYR
jgi:hypothetical protein